MKTKRQKKRVRAARAPDPWPEWPPHGLIGGPLLSPFAVDVELANYRDVSLARQGKLSPEKVRRMTIRGVVDPGASRLVIPSAVADQLGLPRSERVRVTYADGRKGWRDTADGVWLSLLGRDSVYVAILEPKRESARIGAIVLQDLDLLVDCKNQRLVPRDPKWILNEIE